MKVVFHDNFYQVYTSDPAAEQGRMEAVVEVIGPHVEFITAQEASERDIEAVHSPGQIDYVKRHGMHPIATLAAGGAIQAATIGLVEPCFGLIRPPGHHASANSSWGFCYYNNMAVALAHLKREEMISNAYVLDIDLHYGDGTVNILGNKDYVRIHNLGTSDRNAYLKEVETEMEGCSADIIGVSAGFDNHQEDWGGVLATEDYHEIGRLVRRSAIRSNGGCFAILEGGYNHRVLGHNVLALMEGMSLK